jgi:peptidyl-prolyl cis-trans isomerase SurA
MTTACRPAPPAPAATPTPSANTWAVVDGHEITRDDVDKAYRRTETSGQTLSDEETLTAKLSLLDNLILQEILIARARTKNITVPDADLEAAFNDAKKNIGDDAFQKELTQRGLTPTDMREGLRRELLTRKVIEQEIASKTTVSDKEVTDFFGANRAQFNVAEESYHLAQIVVTPGRDTQVTNSNGDDATTPQAAAAKVQMLIERLKGGTSFRELAAGYSEDPESAPRGGDLGLVPMSRLKQAPPPLRNAVLGKEPGSVNVASSGGAHTLVLVVAHELAGQRDLSTAGVREGITETLRSRKDQLFRAAYLMAVRTNAKIVNYLANRLVSATGPMPGLLPATPGGK